MTLGNKLRSLRSVEGSLRGLGRPMTQQELAKAMKKEVGRGLSQAYLSQIESGTRPHLTHGTRTLLARFFRVYPGFLVDDPEGWSRRMLAHIGLPWDPRCLEFHRTDRPVLTASNWQVRQPIGKGSVERWRRYERFIEPLRQALGDA